MKDRFAEERIRLGFSNPHSLSQALGVSHTSVKRVELGESVPGGDFLKEFALLGADVGYVLTGNRSRTIDLNTLGVSEAALRLAYERKFTVPPDGSAFRTRIVATVYNQVVSNLKAGENPAERAVLCAELLIDSLHDPNAPDLIERNLFQIPPRDGLSGVSVKGDGNRVAGRDMIGGKSKK